MALISFGRIDKKLLLIVFIVIINLIKLIVVMEVNGKYYNKTLMIITREIGAIIIGLFMYCKYKEKQNKIRKNKKSFKYILYLFLFRLIKSSYEIFYNNIINDKYIFAELMNTTNGLELILMSIGTYILLKYKYYIHHIISMIIYLSLSIAIDFILQNFQNSQYDYVYIYVISVVNEISFFCYLKYLMDKIYYNYKEVVIYMGITGFITNMLGYGAVFIYQYKLNTKESIINELREYFVFDITKVLSFIFLQLFFVLLNGGFYYLLIVLMIFYFKPNYIVMTDEIYVFIECIAYKDKKNKYYTFIPFFVQIFVLLIYFEIIELNFFKLNENTTKNILKREEIEKEEENEDEQLKDEIEQIELNGEYILNLDVNEEN